MKRILLTGIWLLMSAVGYAQGTHDLVINEVLVDNVNNYEDDYGHRVSWVEIHNTGFSKLNVASCYLVIESDQDTIAYRIPKNDSRTSIDPQGYIVFFCEGTQTKGTFHTNFTLDMNTPKEPVLRVEGDSTVTETAVYPNKLITLSLLEANGRDTISKVVYNLADQKPDISMGLHPNQDGELEFIELSSTTPYATNITTEELPAHERFRRTDPYGYGMVITAMSVVLVALFLLYICFRLLGKAMLHYTHRTKVAKTDGGTTATSTTGKVKPGTVSGEELAAIATALKMYEDDLHDNEYTVLTINRVAKAYSPWSSKLYGLTPMPSRHRR